MIKETISFSPKEVIKALLEPLSERSRDILKKRYGLESNEGLTLEAIGQQYGITRERVRQIEDFSLNHIRQSPTYQEAVPHFAELEAVMNEYGGVVHEQEFLNHLDARPASRNQIHFLLVLGGAFAKRKETDHFHHRWTTNHELAEKIENSLRGLCQTLTQDDLLTEEKVVAAFLDHLSEEVNEPNRLKARRWLSLSKEIGKSPVGEWGLAASPNVRVRGIRDYAFLILRGHGKPLHFREVAKAISEQFGKKANPATCHNELIKDKRFVLVGRGIYALSEWGFQPGIVRDVIKSILSAAGPLTETEIMNRVLKARQVKPNTVLVNLKNPRYFKKNKEGKYIAVA